jgi:hypothetical protein
MVDIGGEMRIARFAVALTLALAAAPTLMAATRPTPLRAVAHSSSTGSLAAAMKLPANMELRANLDSGVLKNGRFTFTATVNGAASLQVSTPGYWFAVVNGGTPPYSYFWLLDEWHVGGNSSSYMGSIGTTGSHYIYVIVTDASGLHTTSNQFAINVH